MFDFANTHDAPVVAKIKGKDYNLPRFLMPALMEWVQKRNDAIIEKAMEGIKDESDRVRFKAYFIPPVPDVSRMLAECTSPEGVNQVLTWCMDKAGVPAADRDDVIANGDPSTLYALVCQLTQAGAAAAQASVTATGEADGAGDSPLSEASGTSAGSPSIGPPSEADSTKSTPDSKSTT